MIESFIVKNLKHIPPHEIFSGSKDPHAEVPQRLEIIEQVLKDTPDSKLVYPDKFIPLKPETVRQVHSPQYVDYLTSTAITETGDYRYPSVFPYRRSDHKSIQPNALLGYYSTDLYTPVNNNVAEAAFLAAQAAQTAALSVIGGEKVVYVAARPPGHHAGHDYMGGYCYLNNAAIAARALSNEGKVVVLDVDYHHGNGTEDIFQVTQKNSPKPRVLTISIHADPNRKFPYFTGKTRKITIAPPVMGYNYDLPVYVTDEQYQDVLEQALTDIDRFGPKYLVVPVGFDTHEKDPLGDFKLTTGYYETMANSIARLGIPTVFIQEGGYNLETIGDNLKSFTKGLLSALS